MYRARSGANSSPSALCAIIAGQKSGHPGNVGLVEPRSLQRCHEHIMEFRKCLELYLLLCPVIIAPFIFAQAVAKQSASLEIAESLTEKELSGISHL